MRTCSGSRQNLSGEIVGTISRFGASMLASPANGSCMRMTTVRVASMAAAFKMTPLTFGWSFTGACDATRIDCTSNAPSCVWEYHMYINSNCHMRFACFAWRAVLEWHVCCGLMQHIAISPRSLLEERLCFHVGCLLAYRTAGIIPPTPPLMSPSRTQEHLDTLRYKMVRERLRSAVKHPRQHL